MKGSSLLTKGLGEDEREIFEAIIKINNNFGLYRIVSKKERTDLLVALKNFFEQTRENVLFVEDGAMTSDGLIKLSLSRFNKELSEIVRTDGLVVIGAKPLEEDLILFLKALVITGLFISVITIADHEELIKWGRCKNSEWLMVKNLYLD